MCSDLFEHNISSDTTVSSEVTLWVSRHQVLTRKMHLKSSQKTFVCIDFHAFPKNCLLWIWRCPQTAQTNLLSGIFLTLAESNESFGPETVTCADIDCQLAVSSVIIKHIYYVSFVNHSLLRNTINFSLQGEMGNVKVKIGGESPKKTFNKQYVTLVARGFSKNILMIS